MTTHSPLIIDVAGYELTPADERRLLHPLVGGMILFGRNFQSRLQIQSLCQAVKKIRPDLLITVDHEGGRVQRFKTDGFTHLPAMGQLGEIWMKEPTGTKIHANTGALAAMNIATACGYVLASELRACGVDFSFTPVLDLNYGNSQVIANGVFLDKFQPNLQLNEPTVIGFAGRYHTAKGYPYLFETMGLLKDKNIIFKIAGGGASLENPEVKALFEQYQLGAEKVHLLDQISDMPAFYQSIDAKNQFRLGILLIR